jgi:metal-responsive CopG/Arc/MetJ family transcriptional regulator
MRHAKISITLEPEVAAELDQVVGRRGRSAFVNAAVRQRLQAARVRKMLDQMDAEAGPIPADVQRRVDGLDWPD